MIANERSSTTVNPAGSGTLHHHSRRMGGRDPHEAHRVATPLELLFDLTFVDQLRARGLPTRPCAGGGPLRGGPARLRLCELRHLLGLGQLLLVRLGLRHRRLDFPHRHHGADDRRAGPGDRPAAHVRLDRAWRTPRQLGHGARLRDHARRHGVPMAARGQAGSRPAPCLPDLCHRHLDRPGRLGGADLPRFLARRDLDPRLRPRAHRSWRGPSSPSAGTAARPGMPITLPSATACSPSSRWARGSWARSRRCRPWSRNRAGRWMRRWSASPASGSPSACGGSITSCRQRGSSTPTAIAPSSGATARC